jgi:hypothetical protein
MTKRSVGGKPIPGPILNGALDAWREGEEQHYIPITGGSMLPLIRNGDQVLVAHGSGDVSRGDVVVFRQESGLVAHRILRVIGGDAEPVFLTKGDNTSQADSPVHARAVVGRVLAVKRAGRELRLDTALWRTVGWSIAVFSLIFSGLYGWGRSIKRKVIGDRHIPGVSTVRRGVSACWSSVLSAIQSLFGRWRE